MRILSLIGLAVLGMIQLGCTSSSRTASTDRSGQLTGETFVIVHGAWGGGWAFKDVARRLTADGNLVYRPTLTGQGERAHLSSPDIDLDTHINDVVNVILYEDLHDIVLVGHSYGGMVISGVMDRVPDRIKRVVYVDAFVPEDGESANDVRRSTAKPSTQPASAPSNRMERDGFLVPLWVKPDAMPPHDVPQSMKTFSQPVSLKNESARKLPVTYILTVDPGTKPEDDGFYGSYLRAKARGWKLMTLDADHNAQWSNPAGLVSQLERSKTQ